MRFTNAGIRECYFSSVVSVVSVASFSLFLRSFLEKKVPSVISTKPKLTHTLPMDVFFAAEKAMMPPINSAIANTLQTTDKIAYFS